MSGHSTGMSSQKAAITVYRSREEVERRWQVAAHDHDAIGAVTFKDAPGDRGTEIHVELDEDARPGKLGEVVQKVTGDEPMAKAKDILRRFKAKVETGEVPTIEGQPSGRKPKKESSQTKNKTRR